MKFLCASLIVSAAVAEQTCTHGKLFVTDANSTSVRIFDVSSGNLENLSPETSIAVAGKPGIYLDVSGSGKEVATIFRGTGDAGYLDGVVNFVDTGVSTEHHGDHHAVAYTASKLVENAGFECARAIHFVRHDNKIAIFCDGSYDFDPQVNSTVWVLDESKFGGSDMAEYGGGDSAIVYTETLQGSHHGVAVPVDDDHVLYSLATEARKNRWPEGADQALPNTFQVVDYQGKVLHSLTDEASPDASCSGFHGSSALDNAFALACDADHGGILIVNYEAGGTPMYESRSLAYPGAYEEHRTGSFQEHPKAEFILGNFAGQGRYHLMAFQDEDTVLEQHQVLSLGSSRQCAFAFEQGEARVVLVFMPTGFLHAFEYENDAWTELGKTQIVTGGLEACSDVLFVSGVQQAFVLHKESKTLYGVDLAHVDDGEMTVKTSQLDFTPFAAVVGGVPPDVACTGHRGHDDHGHDDLGHDDHDVDEKSAAASLLHPAGIFFATGLIATTMNLVW